MSRSTRRRVHREYSGSTAPCGRVDIQQAASAVLQFPSHLSISIAPLAFRRAEVSAAPYSPRSLAQVRRCPSPVRMLPPAGLALAAPDPGAFRRRLYARHRILPPCLAAACTKPLLDRP